jgi:hypothetical protein
MLNENKQTLLYKKTNDDRLLTTTTNNWRLTTVVSLVNSGYVASEQTTKKTPRFNNSSIVEHVSVAVQRIYRAVS